VEARVHEHVICRCPFHTARALCVLRLCRPSAPALSETTVLILGTFKKRRVAARRSRAKLP